MEKGEREKRKVFAIRFASDVRSYKRRGIALRGQFLRKFKINFTASRRIIRTHLN